jgi:hypothetical protein
MGCRFPDALRSIVRPWESAPALISAELAVNLIVTGPEARGAARPALRIILETDVFLDKRLQRGLAFLLPQFVEFLLIHGSLLFEWIRR